jgi:hypothetical protein
MFFQFHGRMQICTGLGYALFALFLMAPVNESLADCRSDTVRISNELVKLFAAGSLSVNTAKKLMGNRASVNHQEAHWYLQSTGCFAIITLTAKSQEESVDDARLQLDNDSGLLLQDLEKSLGPWKLVFASKTSGVRFQIAGRGGKRTIIYANLFTHKPVPGSPVSVLQLRRDGIKSVGDTR